MFLPSGRVSAIFKTRLPIVYLRQITLNISKRKYVAVALTYLQINKEGSIPKDFAKQDSLVKCHNCNLFSEPNITRLEKLYFSVRANSNLKNNAQKYSTSRSFSSQSKPPKKSSSVEKQKPPTSKLSKIKQLKEAFKEYGLIIIAFHLVLTLISFAGFYALVYSGMNVDYISKYFEISSKESTFVVALIIHKIMTPVRVSITLGVTPILVRFLRSKGFMKPKTKTL